jgi:UPF0176 protein
MSQTVITFYKFFPFPDFAKKKESLLNYCQKLEIKGTILLAAEGINATISGSSSSIDSVLTFLRSDPRLTDLEVKKSRANDLPFKRLKVKLKKEIVTLGLPEIDPNQKVGIYVKPKDWNKIISDPEVFVIDTRNEYEVHIGTFKNAIDPHTHSFREFPEYVEKNFDPQKHKKIAMFCTGGIRCEKASSLMVSKGFQEVYHLEGGILKYLEEVPASESLWEGECFVFDERIALKQDLDLGSYDMCRNCGHPINEEDTKSPHYHKDISCPYCIQ